MVEAPRSPKDWYEVGLRLSPGAQMAYYQEGLQRGESYRAWAKCGIGLAWLRKGDPSEAILHLEGSTTLDPGLVAAWNNLGLARESAKDLTGALAAFNQAARLTPAESLIVGNIARVRKRLKLQGLKAAKHKLSLAVKVLLVLGLTHAVLFIGLDVAWTITSSSIVTYADYQIASITIYPILIWVGYGSYASLLAGFIGLWVAHNRHSAGFLVIAIAGFLINILDRFLLEPGLVCLYFLLALGAYAPYFATLGLAWRGRSLSKIILPILGLVVGAGFLMNYAFVCIPVETGSIESPFLVTANFLYDLQPYYNWAYTLLWLALWIDIYRRPTLGASRKAGKPTNMELDFGL